MDYKHFPYFNVLLGSQMLLGESFTFFHHPQQTPRTVLFTLPLVISRRVIYSCVQDQETRTQLPIRKEPWSINTVRNAMHTFKANTSS